MTASNPRATDPAWQEKQADRARNWAEEPVESAVSLDAKCATCGHKSYRHGPERCLDCRSSDRTGAALPVVACTAFVATPAENGAVA